MVLTLQPETTPALTAAAELDALLHRVACAPLPDLGWIRVTGADRVRWLNGMVTNSITALAPGEGCYNFVLNAQGRIQGDLTAFLLPDCLLLQTSAGQVATLLPLLDRFIIMDDVELAEITAEHIGLLVAGPDALRIVQQLGGTPCTTASPPAQLPSTLNLKQTTYGDAPVWLLQAYSPLVPRFEIWASADTNSHIIAELNPVPHVTPQTLEALRLLEGTPLYGIDIRNTDTARDLPQETALPGIPSRALHFSKGCYLGQEIVERIRSRGNVHRTFSGFALTGPLPAPGTLLQVDGKPVGELTSVAAIPLRSDAPPLQLALGYVRRELLERASGADLSLTYPGGTASPIALPYPGAGAPNL